MGNNIKNVKNFNDIDYVGKETVESLHTNKQESVSPKVETSAVKTKMEEPRKVNRSIPQADERFVPLDLPSNYVFYDYDELRVRKFNIRDAAKLTNASDLKSYVSFRDAIQCCINQDVDNLTLGDFKFICYWLRANSFPKTPITVEWTSKYGNRLVTPVLKNQITTLVTDITKEQFKEWQDKGFDVPRMKFSEVYDTDLDSEGRFLYDNGIYFKGDTWKEKIDNLMNYTEENGLDGILILNEFDKLIEHGVEEKVMVLDTKFDVDEYKKKLKNKIVTIVNTMERLVANTEDYEVLESLKYKLEAELTSILEKEAKGEVVQAEPEPIFLEMGPDELLSPLQSKRNN